MLATRTEDGSADGVRLEDVNLATPEAFRNGFPHAMFRVLRREAPVYRHPASHVEPFWVVSRYKDVWDVSLDQATFSSAMRGTILKNWREDELLMVRQQMLNMDPPKHTKYRRLVNQGFSPKRVNRLEPHIREMAAKIVDAVARRGSCDFVTDVAAELPLQVIVELMGVPLEDRHLVFQWSNRMIGFDDPDYSASEEDGKAAAMEMFMYAHELAQRRRTEPRDDLVSVLMQAEVEGEKLDESQFNNFFLLLLVAGNETTRNLISGGMLALFEHPDQLARLVRDPSLMPTAVEEMLRWVSPVMYFVRTATRDVELRGQRIAEGERVTLWYGSANRDEEVFERPDTFDVGRTPNDHLAFGIGPHFCLGANLARLEIRVMFEELLRRLPDIELAGPVARLRSNFIHGIKSMPVRFTPER
ncbi:MAG TPA: cytochrome P450 [Candidatus Binatia bacterium]|nr:cytochrome P450 [Candidatus Binatia bacterium]